MQKIWIIVIILVLLVAGWWFFFNDTSTPVENGGQNTEEAMENGDTTEDGDAMESETDADANVNL